MRSLQILKCFVIAVMTVMVGCDSRNPSSGNDGNSSQSGEHTHSDGTVHKSHAVEGHAHGEGPHGGTIVDWGGGKFHVEFTVSHDKQEATVYVLGSDEKTATSIDAAEITLAIKDPSFQVALKPSPQDGDSEGKSSRFVGNHANLGIVREYEGSLSGVVDETPYSGNFKEVAH